MATRIVLVLKVTMDEREIESGARRAARATAGYMLEGGATG